MAQADPGLEIGVDRPLQERLWFWQRVGWLVMLLLVLAALAGVTGTSGPASRGRIEAGGSTLDYPRIARWQAADSFSIEFAEDAGGATEVLIPGKFIDVFAIESVTPQPSRVTATPDGHLFEFALAETPGRKGANFAVRPKRPTFPTQVRGSVAGAPYAFSFTVLP